MEELINRAAEAQGITPELVERSVKARAAAKGVSVEALLTEWAGGEAAAPGSAPDPAAEEAPSPSSQPAAAPAAEAPEAPSGPQVEVLGPAEEEPAEAPEEEAPVEEEPAAEPAGALAGFPRWLAAAFVVIPTVAMLYVLLAPGGPNCGVSGQLALDPVTGEAVNCDGSAYGVEVVDNFSIGEEIYISRCAACHGDTGGGGTGPAFTGGSLLTVFPAESCDAHIQWVSFGTAAFPEPTYGASDKPVGGAGQMPGFSEEEVGGPLSAEDIAAVVLYERVAFGGQPLPDAEADCLPEEDDSVTASSE